MLRGAHVSAAVTARAVTAPDPCPGLGDTSDSAAAAEEKQRPECGCGGVRWCWERTEMFVGRLTSWVCKWASKTMKRFSLFLCVFLFD